MVRLVQQVDHVQDFSRNPCNPRLQGLRGKAWRIGLMGDSARETNVFAVLSALESIMSSMDYEVAYGASLAAAQQALINFDVAG